MSITCVVHIVEKISRKGINGHLEHVAKRWKSIGRKMDWHTKDPVSSPDSLVY